MSHTIIIRKGKLKNIKQGKQRHTYVKWCSLWTCITIKNQCVSNHGAKHAIQIIKIIENYEKSNLLWEILLSILRLLNLVVKCY